MRHARSQGAAGVDAAAPPGLSVSVGACTYPTVITVTGQTAVVLESHGYTVILINLKTRHVLPALTVGAFPAAVAITA